MNAFYTPAGGGSLRFDNRPKKKSLGYGQSEVTVCLSVGKGVGSFFTPLQVDDFIFHCFLDFTFQSLS
jgi:hypothetical protein